ncbi:UNVERIFIED_CONTAM: hypothetical protein GTU68_036770 [Idotea baltica]|nr:hypothetical protein [Idotea baltica]
MAKRQINRRQSWRIKKIQDERAERAIRRESKVLEALNHNDLGEERLGLVIAHFGVQIEIEALEGDTQNRTFRCYRRANLPALVTGDQVVWRPGQDNEGVITALLPRTSILCRPDTQGQLKPTAANISLMVIVFAPTPEPYTNLIDRYLIAAEHANIRPLLLLNKADSISTNNKDKIEGILNLYAKLGYSTLKVSAQTGEGIEAFKDQLSKKTSVFVGQSGVGKSSLINRLLPEANTRVGALSTYTGKGTHTTTTARLFHFPREGKLIDSPGIREFTLSHVTINEITAGFIEFKNYIGRCRFRNCQHSHEPGCALRQAVDAGLIPLERMNNYHSIIASLPEISY